MAIDREPEILVVDDQKTFRELNCSALRSGGFMRLRCAADGEEAYELHQQTAFDLIISDLEMPRMTGLQLAEAIRTGRKYTTTPIVLLTSRADAAFVLEARKLMVLAYLLKPATPTQILQTTRKCLASSALANNLQSAQR